MNRMNTKFAWLHSSVVCSILLVGSANAQQGSDLESNKAKESSWQLAQPQPEIESENADSEGMASEIEPESDPSVPEVITEPAPASKSSVINDAQLRRDVDAAYAALTKTLEEEDSFSPALGEHYLAYGHILLKAGQPRDARKAFASALHIQKVNHGIYDLQQRHILKSMFDAHYILDEPDDYEDVLRRILWLEDKNDGYKDDLSYDMILKVGNANIDRFLRRPSASELALSYLSKAKRYFQYAVRRFGDVPLTEKKLPYGELALVSLLEGTTQPRLERPPQDRFAAFDMTRANRIGVGEHKRAVKQHAQKIHLGGDKDLRQYFMKAEAEGNQREIVHALLSLGDMAQLFQRTPLAHRYYVSAWEGAQDLANDDPLRTQMNQPVQLPAFNYAMERKHVERRLPSKLIPMSFDVLPSGKSTNILPMADDSEHIEYYKSARRSLRKLTFRPAIIDGEVVQTSLTGHGVRILYKPAEEENVESTDEQTPRQENAKKS